MRVLSKIELGVPVSCMKDGDVAIVMQHIDSRYIGCVIQRFGKFLVALGKSWGEGWSNYFELEEPGNRPDFSCKILPKGTQFEL